MTDPLRDKRQPRDTEHQSIPDHEDAHDYLDTIAWVSSLMEQEGQTADNGSFIFDPNGAEYTRYCKNITEAVKQSQSQEDIFEAIESVGGMLIQRDGVYRTLTALVEQWNAVLHQIRDERNDETKWQALHTKKGDIRQKELHRFMRESGISEAFDIAGKLRQYLAESLHNDEIPEDSSVPEASDEGKEITPPIPPSVEEIGKQLPPQPLIWEQRLARAKSMAEIIAALDVFEGVVKVSSRDGDIEYTREDFVKIMTEVIWGGRGYLEELPLSIRTVVENKMNELHSITFNFSDRRYNLAEDFDRELKKVQTSQQLWVTLIGFGGIATYVASDDKNNRKLRVNPMSVNELRYLWDEMEQHPEQINTLLEQVPAHVGEFRNGGSIDFRKIFKNIFAQEHPDIQIPDTKRELFKEYRLPPIDPAYHQDFIDRARRLIDQEKPPTRTDIVKFKDDIIGKDRNNLSSYFEIWKKELVELEDILSLDAEKKPIPKDQRNVDLTTLPEVYILTGRYRPIIERINKENEPSVRYTLLMQWIDHAYERVGRACELLQDLSIPSDGTQFINKSKEILRAYFRIMRALEKGVDISGIARAAEMDEVYSTLPKEGSPGNVENPKGQPTSLTQEPPVEDQSGDTDTTESVPTTSSTPTETPTTESDESGEIDGQDQEVLAQGFWDRQAKEKRETIKNKMRDQLQRVIDAGGTEFHLTLGRERQTLTDRDQERFAAHRMIAQELGFQLSAFHIDSTNRRVAVAFLEPLVLGVAEEPEQTPSQETQPQESQPPEQEPEVLEPIEEEERELTEEERYWRDQQSSAQNFFNSIRNERRREEARAGMIAQIQGAIRQNRSHFQLAWRFQRQTFNRQDQDRFSAFRVIAHGLGYRLGDFEFTTGSNNRRFVRARLDLLSAVVVAPQEQQPTTPEQPQPNQPDKQPKETPEQKKAREEKEKIEKAMKDKIDKINVSADEVQEGRRKALALGIDNPEIIKMLDHKEVQQNYAQLIQEVSDVVLAKETWFGSLQNTGPQAGHEAGERHLGTREQEVIQKMIEQLGPNAQNIPQEARLTEDFCHDLFYSAKRQVLENAMLGKKLGQPYQDAQTGKGYAEASTRRERSRSKVGGILGRAVGWWGLSALALSWNPVLAVGVLTGARVIDGLYHHNKQRRNVNKWKEENYDAARGQLLHSFSFSIANYVENTNRNRIRAEQGIQDPLGVDEYYNRFLGALTAENNALEEAQRLSAEDIQSRAMRFALYYSMDDEAKTRYQEAMDQRSQGAQHGYHEFFGTVADGMRTTRPLGFTKQDRNRGILWHNTSPRDKAFAGATALGVGLGLSFLRTFGVAGAAAVGAYSGWKMGGALADSGGIGRPWGGPHGRWGFALRTGRNAPETGVEQSLKALESGKLGEYEKTLQKIENELTISDVANIDAQLQPMLKVLAETQPYIENLKNHHEFSHQYERFKKMYTKVMHLKLLVEWERPLWSTNAQPPRVRPDGLRTGEKSIPQKFETIQQTGGSLHAEYTEFRQAERTRSGMYDAQGNNVLDIRNRNRRLVYKVGGAIIGAFLLGEVAHLREVAHAADGGGATPHGPVPLPDAGHLPMSAVVGRGEGVEHVLHRQLGQNHDAFSYFSQRYGTGDRGNLAHLIARDYGYVDNAGHEVRVLDTGVAGAGENPAYWLHKTPQGTWAVGEYTYDPTRGAYAPFETHTAGAVFERPSDISHEYDFSKSHDATPSPTLPQGRGATIPPLERRTEGVSSSLPSPLKGEGRVRFEPLAVPSPQGMIVDGHTHELQLPNTDAHVLLLEVREGEGELSSTSPFQGEGGVRSEALEALRESIGATGDIPGPVSGSIGAEEANILTSFHAIHQDADVGTISKTLEHLSKDEGGPWNHITMHDHHAWVRPVTDPHDIARFSHGELSSPSPLQGEGGVGSQPPEIIAVKFGASNPQTPDVVLEQLPKGNEKIISIRHVLPNGARGHELHDYTEWLKDHPIKGTDKDIGTVDVIPNAHHETSSAIAGVVETGRRPVSDDDGKAIAELFTYDAKKIITPEWLDSAHTIIHDDASFQEVVGAVKQSELVEYMNTSIDSVDALGKYKGNAQSLINNLLSDDTKLRKNAAIGVRNILGLSAQDMLNKNILNQQSWHSWRVLAGIVEHLDPKSKLVFDTVEQELAKHLSKAA